MRRIGNRKQQVSSIPALKDGANWILEAEAKANCFATTFESKNTMIDEEANEYTEILDSHLTFYCGLLIIEATEQALKTLDEDSAPGPDMSPTRINVGFFSDWKIASALDGSLDCPFVQT